MSRRSHRLSIVSVLLAALIHQLGASPCGCVEHNSWLHAIADVSDSSHRHVGSGGAEVGTRCDHPGPLLAEVPRSVKPPVVTGTAFVRAASRDLVSDTLAATRLASDRLMEALLLWLPVRALTQVFRL